MTNIHTHLCHERGDTHWLTPDPAWSRHSFGMGLCIREPALGERSSQPFRDAVAGLAAGIVATVRRTRLAA